MGKMNVKKMNVKKTRIVLAILLLCAACAVWSVGAAIRGPELVVDILRYEPSPVEPGDYFEVWIGVQNKGTRAMDFWIEYVPEYPFSLAPGEEEVKKVKGLPALEDAVLKFKFFVDVNAPMGDQTITFNYQTEGVPIVKLEKTVTIKSAAAVLTVDSYKVTPELIKPGDQIRVELTLKNNGKVGVKNIDVNLELENASKFTPVAAGTKRRVGVIDAGEEKTVTFDLIADTSTEIKVYTLPIKLSYEDFRGNSYSDTAKISLVVGAEPELLAIVDSTAIVQENTAGEVSIKIVNNGIINLKYLNVRLITAPDYDVLSPSNEAYIGNLDSDDFETVEFVIKPKIVNPKLKLAVDFKDPYNKDYSKSFELPLRIVSPEELGKKKTPYATIAIVVLVVLGAVYWLHRRRAKRKK